MNAATTTRSSEVQAIAADFLAQGKIVAIIEALWLRESELDIASLTQAAGVTRLLVSQPNDYKDAVQITTCLTRSGAVDAIIYACGFVPGLVDLAEKTNTQLVRVAG